MNYNTIYRDKRRSLIDVNMNENTLVDVYVVTLAYLEQQFKPRYSVFVNQLGKIMEYTLIDECHELKIMAHSLQWDC